MSAKACVVCLDALMGHVVVELWDVGILTTTSASPGALIPAPGAPSSALKSSLMYL